MSKQEYYSKLDALVAAAREYQRNGFGGVDPEEATKQHLIEPLLDALGYTRAEYDKEYHILRDQVDYLLKHNRPLMFLEAKSLLDHVRNLYEAHQDQVTNYIRNYRVSPQQVDMERPVTWIVLTNFAQIHFIRVNEDQPTFSFRLDELVARRDELWDLLALDNVEHGLIDDIYSERQHADLDKRFLADLKRWRLIIANGFALRNQTRSLADLTKASQQLLDRFIFCRMLETNHLVEHNKLIRQFVGYEEFFGEETEKSFAEFLRESLFREIKRNFNTELFEQPLMCDELAIDNDALAVVIGHAPLTPDIAALAGLEQGQGDILPFKHLYGYDFSRMSGDIMGAVYERFLAHKLDLKNGRITIEDTDELRKKEGIYYTPRYIVDYIVAHTVGEKITPIVNEAITLVAYKNYKGARAKIGELAQVKVLDAAMGSGSFLLRAFDTIVAGYTRYNEECRKQKREQRTGAMTLFDAPADIAEEVDHLGIRVAAENIFGVDLDEQAVEVAKLNVWMRLMVAERDYIREMLRIRTRGSTKPLNLLPTLANNLKRGNSLIDDPTVAGNTSFDWDKEFGGIRFDCVVGNPPFERIQVMQASKPELVDYLKANYQSAAAGSFDIYVCFIERGLQLLNPNGLFGFITPHKFCQSEYGEPLRKLLAEGKHIRHIVYFGDEQVFPQVTIYTCLLFLDKAGSETCRFTAAHDLAAWRESGKGEERNITITGSSAWNFVGADSAMLFDKLKALPQKLGDVADIFVGLQTSADDVFILDLIAAKRDTLRLRSRASNKEVTLERALCHPLVSGEDVTNYGALTERQFIIFPYMVKAEKAQLIDFDVIAKKYPKIRDYLLEHKKRLEDRENGSFKDAQWYRFGRSQNIGIQEREKICVPRLVDELHAAYDATGEHYLDNVDVGGVTLKEEYKKLGLPYLLALLNSTLLRWYFPSVSAPFHSGYFSANRQFLCQVPIKLPESKSEKALAAKIVKHVEQIQTAHGYRSTLPAALNKQIAHSSNRTPCTLAHYTQADYANAIKTEKLIDDVQRKGFVTGIAVQADKNTVTITADVADTKTATPVSVPVVRLRFTNEPFQQFIYASWQSFLAANARKKAWTTGKTPQPVYDLIVNGLEPLVYFLPAAADNLRVIRDVMKAVAQAAGTADLAAVESEIAATDKAINALVYQLYDLKPEEIALIEGAA